MTVYEHYATRDRIGLGVKVKRYQARRIFAIGLQCSARTPTSVLEIGPGDGYIAELAQRRAMRYIGIEGSAAVADHLRSRGFEIVTGRVPPLPQGSGTFDCCFLLHVIEHMRDFQEAVDLVASIRESLIPGGVLVAACPDFVRWGHYFYDCDYTHSTPFTRRRLCRLLEEQDFEILNTTIYCGPAFGYRWLPVSWLVRFFYPAFIDDIVGRRIAGEAANRALLTLLPNLLVVASRRGEVRS